MKQKVSLSIAFITYNRADELIRAIESCFPLPTGSEIMIWDNCSNQENSSKVNEYANQKQGLIQYFYSEANLGVAGGRNAIWQKCSGEYVFFLDDDAILDTPDLFQRAVEVMAENPQIGALACDIYEPETGNSLNCPVVHSLPNEMDMHMSFVGCAHFLRRSAFAKDYLYPRKLMFGSEELYASLYLWANGYEVRLAQELKILHLPSKINRYGGKERDLNFIVNQYIIKKLAYPIWTMPILWLVLQMRLVKNHLGYHSAKELIDNRFDPNESMELSTKTLLVLIQRFGFVNIF